MKKNLWLTVALCLGLAVAQARADELERGFAAPPASAKPWVFWFWIDGNITKAGITADLEAMQRAGIGGAQIFSVSQAGIPAGDVKFMTPEWRAMFSHVVTEAERLGMKVVMQDSDSWCGSGGPWIKPEQSMQQLVWTETRVQGPTNLSVTLAPPPVVKDFYRDVAVLAFPLPEGDEELMADAKPKITSSETKKFDPAKMLDGDLETIVSLAAPAPKTTDQAYIQFEFARPYRARALSLALAKRNVPLKVLVQVSDDGKNFRTVGTYFGGWRYYIQSGVTMAFDEVSSRFYRVVFSGAYQRGKRFDVAEVELHGGARMNYWEAKAGFAKAGGHGGETKMFAEKFNVRSPAAAVVRPEQVVNLTARMNPAGQLEWNAPAGRWAILRLGHTSTGKENHPATEAGMGLECDKFAADGIETQFPEVMGKLLADAGARAGKILTGTHLDSWEHGCQTWTATFREEFQRRRGYDLLPYLPLMAGGRVLESEEVSERFLWDLRRTYADLIADNYYGRMRQLAHTNGIQFQAEASGLQMFMYDPLAYQAKSDLPIGEIWVGQRARVDCKVASSVAHLNNLPVVGVEAFTSAQEAGRWQNDPYQFKVLGDETFCAGVNRLFLNSPALQPWTNLWPGMTLGRWGSHTGRTATWWEQGAAWLSYVSRCQYLLQQGKFVGDVCCLPGEGVPNYLGWGKELSLPLPEGYDYDGISADILISRMTVQDGRVVVPSGMSYRVLLLPDSETMTPELLRKIKTLVAAGATVIGPKPIKSPSLRDYPQGDAEVRRLADEVWGDCDGKKVTAHGFGKGRVMWGRKFEEIFSELNLPPDFRFTAAAKTDLKFIHRQAGDAEIYFISNQESQPVDAVCTFRVNGKLPELWHPGTGQIEVASTYEMKNGGTTMPLRFDPSGSMFVVFRKGAKIEKSEVAKNWPEFQPAQEINGAWELSFPPNWGAPAAVNLPQLISWSDHADSGVKYFSGTATYTKEIEIPALLGKGHSLWLDLGAVKNLAEVSVNGKPLGVLWKPPFRVDITGAAKAGKNILEIKVTNLWPNRLIGDEQEPDDVGWDARGGMKQWPQWLVEGKPRPSKGRYTFTTWQHYTKDSPLLPSGLLGPVTLQATVQTSGNF